MKISEFLVLAIVFVALSMQVMLSVSRRKFGISYLIQVGLMLVIL